jgi:chitodextrinase
VWSHLAATYDGGEIRLYVNGSLVASQAASGPVTTSTGVLRIGGNSVWNEWFAGLIDEVRVYNRALSAAEIQTDMQTAVGGGAPPPDTTPPTAPGNLTASASSSSVSLTWSASTDNVGVTRYDVYRSTTSGFTPSAANRIAQPSGTSYTDSGLAAGTYYYKVTAEDAAGNVSAPSTEATASIAPPPPPAPPGLVAAYGFEEGSGSTVADRSGNGNTGTLSNASWSTDGKFGGALSFNGTNAWVSIADSASLRLGSAMTLEAWVNPSALDGSWRTVLLKERAGGLCYALYGHTGALGPSAHVDVGGSEPRARSSTAIASGTWTHLAATYDGSAINLYANGSLLLSAPASGSITSSTGALRIGGNAVWNEWFAGLIDEVRVYNRALSAAEIQSDMQNPVG